MNRVESEVWSTVEQLNAAWTGGRVAAATYYHDHRCEIDSEEVELAGRDMFVLVKEGGRWLAIANQFSEYPVMPWRR